MIQLRKHKFASLDPVEIKSILGLYDSGLSMTVTAIATRMDRGRDSVSKCLKSNKKLIRNSASYGIKLNEHDMRLAIQKYKSGSSLKQVATQFGTHDNSLLYMFKRIGVKRRARVKRKTRNVNFFHKLDEPRKCYWFGFICADGSIPKPEKPRKHSYNLSFSLAVRDVKLLRKLKTDLQSTSKIHTTIGDQNSFKPGSVGVLLAIGSKQICADLNSHGIAKIKNGNTKPIVSLKYHSDFIRGYLDGDGYMSRTKNVVGWCCPHRSTLESFRKILISAGVASPGCHVSETTTSTNNPFFHLRYSGRHQVPRIMDWLCASETFGLARKRF